MKSAASRLALVCALVLCAGGGLFLYRSGFFSAVSSPDALRDYIQQFSPYSLLFFFVIQLLSVVLAPIPSNVSALAGGILFGTWPAFFLTYAAIVLGSVVVFALARAMGRDAVTRLVGRKLSEKYLSVIHAKTDVFLTLAFLFPFFPDDALCILAGLTTIPFPRFLIIVLLARPWGLLFASALGGATLSVPWWGMLLAGLAGLALFCLGMKYGDRIEAAILRRLGKDP